MLTWVIYDIVKDKSRTKIAKFCKEYGLYRVQKSCFLGDLNRNEVDELGLKCHDCNNPERILSCRYEEYGKMSGLLLPECVFVSFMVCFYCDYVLWMEKTS
jgi:CRISPR-associated endonuclease Cas2